MILSRLIPMCRRVTLGTHMRRIGKSPKSMKCSNSFTLHRRLSLASKCSQTNHHRQSDSNGDFVSISQIRQKLLKMNYDIDEGPTCISINCVSCEEPSRLFINKVTGHFICYKCVQAGTWQQLEPALKDPKLKKQIQFKDDCSIVDGSAAWEKICKHLCPIGNVSESNHRANLLKRLELEELPWSLLEKLGVMYDSKNDDMYWPLRLCDQSDVIAGYKTLSSTSSEQCYPHNSAAGVLRISAKTQNGSAVLVPNLKDFLALSMHQPPDMDIICLPHGQFSLPQTVLPLLEHYEKLVLWFGSDITSWNNVRLFARKLSIDRCHLVRPIKEHKSAFEAHASKIDVGLSIRNAQAMSHSSIITFSQLRDDLLTELYSSDQATGIKWTRFPALNSILQGHRRGELTILTGPTGSGKTTLMSEYSLDLAMQQVTTLWGSFEIRNQRLVRTMLQQMAGASLQNNIDKFNEWADKFALLPLYFMTFHGQQPLDAVLETVQHAAYVHDVAHVIIDNVQFMLGMSSSESGFLDRFYRQDALIGAFRNFATTYNCHVTLVIHPRKERDGEALSTSSIFGGAKASQEADNVLIIQHKMSNSGLKIRKYLQVAKNRFSGDLGIIPLEFDRESLSFSPKAKS